MSSTGNGSMRKCPACGAENSNLSLFCAECGTALNGASWQGGTDDTQAYQPVSQGASGSTGNHVPASRSYDTYAGTHAGDPQSTWSGGIGTSYANEQVEHEAPPLVSAWPEPEGEVDRGVRGFVLGSLAWLIIAAVFVLFLWVAVFSHSFKDDVRDLIPGLAMLTIWRL